MQKKFKTVVIIALMVMVLTLFVGCSGKGGVSRQALDENSAYVPVNGTCTIEAVDGKAVVYADTDILDSAIVVLSVNDGNGNTLDELRIIKNGDNLKAEFTIGADWGNELYGFAVMTPDSNGKQPDGIYSAYGKTFGNIESEYLIFTSKTNMVVIPSEKLTLQ